MMAGRAVMHDILPMGGKSILLGTYTPGFVLIPWIVAEGPPPQKL